MQRGLLAEFDSSEACSRAIPVLREHGLGRLDVYMPYPAKEIQKALGARPSPLPRYVLLAGCLGAVVGYLILWYTNVFDYPINVAGRPDHAVPAFIPISFETLVLFAGCAAFVGALWLGGLPRLYHPLDEVEGFTRVSVDRFVLAVDAANEGFDAAEASAILGALGALSVRPLGSGQSTASEPE